MGILSLVGRAGSLFGGHQGGPFLVNLKIVSGQFLTTHPVAGGVTIFAFAMFVLLFLC